MPIPDFDHNYVLPPHLGNPVFPEQASPYECSTLELCKRFATNSVRINILSNFLLFRQKFNEYGIINGFQWLDGSFCEDIESVENRHPNDLDIVTFYSGINDEIIPTIISDFSEFIDPEKSKQNYLIDHYVVDYCYSPDVTVKNTSYWFQLFSHNRRQVWKGILRVELHTPEIDLLALNYLQSLRS